MYARVALFFAVLSLPAQLLAAPAWRPLTPTNTGVNGEALADTPVTDTIDLGYDYATALVTLEATVTAGDSLSMVVYCEESSNATNWVRIPYCTDAAASTCTPQTLTYSLASVVAHAVTITPASRYLRCTFDDAADGTGTVIVRGSVAHR